MDDLVVVILTILLMVAGGLNQLRKKKPPVVQPEGKKQEPEFWETLFGDTEEAEVQTEELGTAPEYDGEINSGTVPADYKFVDLREGDSLRIKKRSEVSEDEQPDESCLMDESDRFSLKKAVIYSEILNRKYF